MVFAKLKFEELIILVSSYSSPQERALKEIRKNNTFIPMKYGYNIRTRHTYPEIRNLALLAEKYSFDSVHVDDHLIGFDPKRKQPYLDAMVLMSAIAAETKRVKVGHIVLANSFRNPALTAKIVSSIDNISNGRGLLWIGMRARDSETERFRPCKLLCWVLFCL